MVSGGRDTDRSRRAVSTSPFQPEPPKKQGNPDILAGTTWQIIPARENPRGARHGTRAPDGPQRADSGILPESVRRRLDNGSESGLSGGGLGAAYNSWLYSSKTERITL